MTNRSDYIDFEKNWLVDVPVKINIWIRPECQRRQFEVIKQARPSILFVTSDGGRNEKEWDAIHENRKMYDTEIDWNCTVYRLYMDENLGMYGMMQKRAELIWDNVDRCVFLEDDHLPAVSFFQYCAELLEKYKDDLRIGTICGYNILGINNRASADYFFSTKGSIWGTATWKRATENKNFEYANDPYVMSLLKEQTREDQIAWGRIQGYGKSSIYDGHVAGSEFFNDFVVYSQHQLQIVPSRNLISNIGSTANAEHADTLEEMPMEVRKMFESPVYEVSFPLKHPKYVIPDMQFARDRNRILAYGHPFIQLKRKLYRGFKKAIKGDFHYILTKVKRKVEK